MLRNVLRGALFCFVFCGHLLKRDPKSWRRSEAPCNDFITASTYVLKDIVSRFVVTIISSGSWTPLSTLTQGADAALHG